MRRLFRMTVESFAVLLLLGTAVFGQVGAGRDYPKMYGATGHLLRSTQAVSPYRGASGRDWRGGSGQHGHHGQHGQHGERGHHGRYGPGYGVDVVVPGYGLWGPAGAYSWGTPGYYDPGSSARYHVVPAPRMPWVPPSTYQPYGVDSAPVPGGDNSVPVPQGGEGALPEESAGEDEEAPEKPVDVTPPTPKTLDPPSNEKAKLASLSREEAGDEQMKLRNYGAAAEEYREAVHLTEDRPEPRFRLAIAEASRGHFEEAVHELKTLYRLHPDWAMRAPTLDMLFGADGFLAKTLVQERVIAWVKEDLRDPDRLFLMGVMLYYDNQFDRAETVLAAAARLGGSKPHLRAMLATMSDTPPPVIGAVDAGAGAAVPDEPEAGE